MHPVFLAYLLFAASARADDTLVYRELPCRVVDEAGRPMRGVAVRLGGLERDAPDFEDDEDRIDREPGWKFTTDADGRFTARFGQFRGYQHLGTDGAYSGPGYGKFYFLVHKAGFAGGVSREVLNVDDKARIRLQADAYQQWGLAWENQEWRRGEFAPLLRRDDQTLREPLVIVLKRGLDVRGRMVDTAGQPVRAKVWIAADQGTETVLLPSQIVILLEIDLCDYFDLGQTGSYRLRAMFQFSGQPLSRANEISISIF